MSGSHSQPRWQGDITSLLKDANNKELLEYPPVKPEVKISQQVTSDKSITKEYVDALVRITTEVAVECGWSAAEITGDVHPTTTNGGHHPRHRPGETVIGSGAVQRIPDEPHITVAMSSEHFPSLNTKYHILTAMADPSIRNLRKRNELRDRTLYPRGFPCRQLISAGPSPRSAIFETPKQAYAKMVRKWKRKRGNQNKKAAMWNFPEDGDDDDENGGFRPPGPPRGSGPPSPGSGGGGSKRTGSSNPFAALDTCTEESESDNTGNPAVSCVDGETDCVRKILQYPSQMRTELILPPLLPLWVAMLASQLQKHRTQPWEDAANNKQWWKTTSLRSG